MKYIICFSTISFFFFTSCTKNPVTKILEFEVEKILIPIDENYLFTYQDWYPYSEGAETRLIAYNDKKHSLDFFSLEAQIPLGQVLLERQGPNGVGRINGIYYHNQDSVFLYERGKLHLANQNGIIAETFSLYDLYGFEGKGEPSLNSYFKLCYLPENKSLPFFITYHQSSQTEKSSLPLITLFNLKNKKFDELPIFHTGFFQKNNGNVGFITYLGFYGALNQMLVYNFQYESGIFALETNKQLKNNQKTQNISPLENVEEIEKHAIINTHYLSPIPDPWKNVIYRPNWEGPGPGKEDQFLEKRISLTIFDKDLNTIQDFTLPDYTYQINNWFVTEKGLFLNVAHPQNTTISENELVFHIIKIKAPPH